MFSATVSLPILNGKNWKKWVVRMHEIFGFQGVLEMVQRGIQEEEGSASYKESKKRDYKALFIIHQCVDEMNFWKISSANSAKEAWEILNKAHGGAVLNQAHCGAGKRKRSQKSNREMGVSARQKTETERNKNDQNSARPHAESRPEDDISRQQDQTEDQWCPEIADQETVSEPSQEEDEAAEVILVTEPCVVESWKEEEVLSNAVFTASRQNQDRRGTQNQKSVITQETCSEKVSGESVQNGLAEVEVSESPVEENVIYDEIRVLVKNKGAILTAMQTANGGSEKSCAVVSFCERRWWWFQCTATMKEEKGTANILRKKKQRKNVKVLQESLVRGVPLLKLGEVSKIRVWLNESLAREEKAKAENHFCEDRVATMKTKLNLDAVTFARMKTQIRVLETAREEFSRIRVPEIGVAKMKTSKNKKDATVTVKSTRRVLLTTMNLAIKPSKWESNVWLCSPIVRPIPVVGAEYTPEPPVGDARMVVAVAISKQQKKVKQTIEAEEMMTAVVVSPKSPELACGVVRVEDPSSQRKVSRAYVCSRKMMNATPEREDCSEIRVLMLGQFAREEVRSIDLGQWLNLLGLAQFGSRKMLVQSEEHLKQLGQVGELGHVAVGAMDQVQFAVSLKMEMIWCLIFKPWDPGIIFVVPK